MSTSASGDPDDTRLDMETCRVANAVEQRRLGCRHPDLPASFELREERGAALRVEVRSDLIEEQDRPFVPALGDKVAMGKDEPEEKRLLLSGRGARRRHLLRTVKDGEILPMRAFGRSARAGIPLTIRAQPHPEISVGPTLQRDRRACESVVGHRSESLIQGGDGARSRVGDRSAMLGHGCFKRGEPRIVPVVLRQQLVSRAHCRFVARGVVHMRRFQSEDQPV